MTLKLVGAPDAPEPEPISVLDLEPGFYWVDKENGAILGDKPGLLLIAGYDHDRVTIDPTRPASVYSAVDRLVWNPRRVHLAL